MSPFAPQLSLGRLGRAMLGTVFPASCAGCGASASEGESFCVACSKQIIWLEQGGCARCGRPVLEPNHQSLPGELCKECSARPPAFDRARAVAGYDGPLGSALRSFKYNHRLALGRPLAKVLATKAPSDLLAEPALLAPVPLHYRRLVARGFNQALVLVKDLARHGELTLARDLLRRVRHTAPQVGLGPRERRDNVAGAFGLSPKWRERLAGQRVLLVDDVYTTGSTVGECARVLRDAGASHVDVLTLVRAVDSKDV